MVVIEMADRRRRAYAHGLSLSAAASVHLPHRRALLAQALLRDDAAHRYLVHERRRRRALKAAAGLIVVSIGVVAAWAVSS